MSPFTTDVALKWQAIADALQVAFARVPGVVALSYDPVGAEVEHATVCVGETSSGERTGPRDQETQLNRDDWDEEWICRLYLRLEDPAIRWPEGRRLLALCIRAIDFDYQLGGEVERASVIDWELAPDEPEDGKQRKLVGEMTVALRYLMPQP